MGIGSDYLNNPFVMAQANVGATYGANRQVNPFNSSYEGQHQFTPNKNYGIEQKPQFGILPEDKYHQAMKAVEINQALANASQKSGSQVYLEKPIFDDGELTPYNENTLTWA